MKQRVKVQGKFLQKKDVNACKSHINRKRKACRNLFLSGKNSPGTHSSANGQILTRTLEQKWLPNERAIELLIRDWKLGTPNLAKIGTKISKREGLRGFYKRLQAVTRGYRGLQGITGGYKGLQGVTKQNNVFVQVTRDYKGLQGVTKSYR